MSDNSNRVVVNTTANVDTTTRINVDEPWKPLTDTDADKPKKMRRPSKNKMRTDHQDKETK